MMPDGVRFKLGQIVFGRVDGRAGMVTGITFRPHGHSYCVTWEHSNGEASVYEMELTPEKPATPPSEESGVIS
jgi:hypothetical protein